MKKVLLFGGIVTTGFAFYYFFKKQIDLALSSDYKIKRVKLTSITKTNATVSCEMEVSNKSSFSVVIQGYDIRFLYNNIEIGHTTNDIPITIPSDSSFDIVAKGDIDITNIKSQIIKLSTDILSNKPVKIVVNGTIFVKFLGIARTIEFKDNDFVYSKNLLETVGLDDDLDRFKVKINNYIGQLGLKL